MPSAAWTTWDTTRKNHLDELVEAHTLVKGEGPGRKWRTSQVNRSLVLLLATELQGFARDLHTEGSQTFAAWAAPNNAAVRTVIEVRLTEGRALDRGNAQPGSLGSDFGRLGFSLWPALSARDALTASRQDALERLNEARNAIAHADEAKLAVLRTAGYPMTLAAFKEWRKVMNALVTTIDFEVSFQLSQLFAKAPPW